MTAEATAIGQALVEKLTCELAKFPEVATRNDYFLALAHVVRDRLLHRWVDTARDTLEGRRRTVIYLSAEYLIGPQLGANLMTLGMTEAAREAVAGHRVTLD